MNAVKSLIIFVVGVAIGAAGGGFIGHRLGSTNLAIDRAPVAGIVEVQEERRPARRTEQATPASETAETVEETAEETEAPVEPETVAEEVPAVEQIEEFEITPNDESQIMWVGYKSVLGQRLSMEGGFANFEGSLTVENNSPDTSFVEVIVDVDMIFSESGILTTVLKGEDFFKVEEFPKARFASTKIEAAEDGRYLVTGNFTLRGVTQGIQFPAVIERRPDGVFAAAEFTIDRKQWNLGYDSYEDSLILNEVVISFEILAEPVD